VANSTTAFAETLLAAEGEYNAAAVARTALMERVYMDVDTEAARIGKTVDVYYPDVAPLKDIGANTPTPSPIAPNYIPMVFQNHPVGAIQVQDYEQFQTATAIAKKFLDPLYKRSREYLNGQIAGLINASNFNYNAPVIGATNTEVLVADQLNAWSNLADNKAPMDDQTDLTLAVHNRVMAKMFQDSNWTQENIVSAQIALAARTTGKLANAYNFDVAWDQQMPSASGTILYGKVAPVNGSATVAGISTAFTSQLTAGSSYIVFGSDPTKTKYLVSAIASDTSLTIGSSYAGATPVQTYTSARTLTVLAGTVTSTNASAAVTGSGTSFTTAGPNGGSLVGSWLIFSNDTTATPYQVLSVASNTALTLATNYTGTGGAGQTAQVQWFSCLAFHRYSIACALRPVATPDSAQRVVDVVYINLRGIPLRVMRSYVHIYMAEFVTVDFGYALQAVRPEWAQLIQV
jgi:hypothetical protein